jgi:hypothetical protein
MTDRKTTETDNDSVILGSRDSIKPSGWFDRFRRRAIRKGEEDGPWWLLDNLSLESTMHHHG